MDEKLYRSMKLLNERSFTSGICIGDLDDGPESTAVKIRSK